LELLNADKKDLANKAADQALSLYTGKDQLPLAPSVVALAMALGRELPPPPKAAKKNLHRLKTKRTPYWARWKVWRV
jgi:hypothetical protein